MKVESDRDLKCAFLVNLMDFNVKSICHQCFVSLVELFSYSNDPGVLWLIEEEFPHHLVIHDLFTSMQVRPSSPCCGTVVGGSTAPGHEMPSAESLVGWLLEHQEVQVTTLSDTDSLSSADPLSDSDSMSDEFEDLEGAFKDVSQVIIFLSSFIS